MINCKNITEIHAPNLLSPSSNLVSTDRVEYQPSDGAAAGEVICPNLHTIDVSNSGSRVKNDLFQCIAERAPNLTKLNIESCGGGIDCLTFVNLITKCSKLTSLQMGGCFGLNSSAMDAILLNLKDISILDIEDCNIATVSSIKKLLAVCRGLTHLKWSFYTKNEPKAALIALEKEYPDVEMTCSRGS
jgi:hypothetical protein